MATMLACVECSVPIEADVWHEELGMCLECSNTYWSDENEEEVV